MTSNTTCLHCGGPAYLGLNESTCMREGGCEKPRPPEPYLIDFPNLGEPAWVWPAGQGDPDLRFATREAAIAWRERREAASAMVTLEPKWERGTWSVRFVVDETPQEIVSTPEGTRCTECEPKQETLYLGPLVNFTACYTHDGKHPTREDYKRMGESIRSALSTPPGSRVEVECSPPEPARRYCIAPQPPRTPGQQASDAKMAATVTAEMERRMAEREAETLERADVRTLAKFIPYTNAEGLVKIGNELARRYPERVTRERGRDCPDAEAEAAYSFELRRTDVSLRCAGAILRFWSSSSLDRIDTPGANLRDFLLALTREDA